MKIYIVPLAILLIFPCTNFAQFSGASFEQRRDAYISDQGRAWEDGGFDNSEKMQAVWAWLEGERQNISAPNFSGKTRRQLISEAIEYITGEGWWGGALPGANPTVRLWFQYGDILSAADRDKLRKRMDELGRQALNETNAVWCAVANWHFPNLIAAYLYNSGIENVGRITYPKPDPQYRCPPTFSYNRHSYLGGNSYNAKIILGDYLEFMMTDWVKNGTDEDLSTADYFQYQIYAVALLVDFAPEVRIREKAKLFLDWLILQHTIGFSANHIAGGHGRSYTNYEFDGRDSFPFSILFNIGDGVNRDFMGREMYVSSYRIPVWLTELVEKINSMSRSTGDDFYRVIRGRMPAFGNIAGKSIGYRYDYVTPNYNLGGTGQGTGWELNIATDSALIKIFFCAEPQTVPDKDKDGRACNAPCFFSSDGGASCRMWYLFSLGQRGWQHRGAIFAQGAAYLHEIMEGHSWDDSGGESGWFFRRKGKIALAMKLTPAASGLEVCTIGVDYAGYDDFKAAVKSRAELGGDFFKTSQGIKISEGYVDGVLPFNRLEVWEGHAEKNDERKIIGWKDNVMTTGGGVYDFSRWASPVLPPPPDDKQAPTPPRELTLGR